MTSRALGDLCDVRIGRTPRRDSPQFWNGDFPWVTISELDGSLITRSKEGITQLAIETVMPPPVPAGTLLFSFKLSIGKMAVAGVPLHTNEAIAALVIRDFDELDRDYLRFALMATSTGDGANHAVLGKVLNKAKVEALQILLLPLEEQRHLVDLLSRAEGIVRLRREAQRKAAELVPALFLDMFGDPASNPKGWQTVSLSEVSTVGSGAGFPIADQGCDTGDYPFYKVGDMNLPGNEEAMASSRNYIDEATRSRLRATAFPPGAVIFPKIGAAIATNKKRVLSIPSCVDNNVMAVVPSDRLLSSYLHALLMHADLSDFASDSNPPSIRKTTVEAWRIPLPPVDLQHQFAAKADAVRGIATQQAAALVAAQATFDALLHQSFQH